MATKRSLLFMLIFTIIIISGCWNARELTDISLISAVGIDKTDAGEFKISFQVLSVGEVATGQEGSARNASTTDVFTVTGDTVFEAIRKVTKKLPRKIYFPHTSLIVISEQFAKEEGIAKVIDWFERDHEFRLNIQVVIARGTSAEDILLVQSPVERVAAKKITNELEIAEEVWGENVVMELDDIVNGLISPGIEITMSSITIVGDVEKGSNLESLQTSRPAAVLEIDGIAVFQKDKLIDWIENEEARGLTWILDKVSSTILNVDCNGEENRLAIEVIRSKTKTKVSVEDDIPKYNINITTEGNIGEASCSIDLTDPIVIKELETLMAEEIKQEAISIIKFAQESKTDILGFGNVIQRQRPAVWKKHEREWPEVFSNAVVEVKVDAFIRRTGMRVNPFHNE